MKDKLLLFLRKNGFLLLLFICVCVVAVGTIYIATKDLRTAQNGKGEDLVILEEIELEEDELEEEVVTAAVDEDLTSEEEIEEALKEDEVAVVENLTEEEIEELEFVVEYEEEESLEFVVDKPIMSLLPIDGEILTQYSLDNLIYSETLEEWRGHLGIDIKASEGDKVRAPLDGTIKEVLEDELWGIVIVIDHGDGLETKFANLGTKEMVTPGLKVNRGDYISTVGKSANIEMMMEPHLHFEATLNGKIIDPRSITR